MQLDIAVTVEPGKVVIPVGGDPLPAEINEALVRAGIAVSEFARRHSTLEDAFLDLTGAETTECGAP